MCWLGDSDPSLGLLAIQHSGVPFSTRRIRMSRFCTSVHYTDNFEKLSAALTTLDAAPASWMVNLKISGEAGIAPVRIVGTRIAFAPVIGTARVVSAAGSIVEALKMANHPPEDSSK